MPKPRDWPLLRGRRSDRERETDDQHTASGDAESADMEAAPQSWLPQSAPEGPSSGRSDDDERALWLSLTEEAGRRAEGWTSSEESRSQGQSETWLPAERGKTGSTSVSETWMLPDHPAREETQLAEQWTAERPEPGAQREAEPEPANDASGGPQPPEAADTGPSLAERWVIEAPDAAVNGNSEAGHAAADVASPWLPQPSSPVEPQRDTAWLEPSAEPAAAEAAPPEPVAAEAAPLEPVAAEAAPLEPVAAEAAPLEPVAAEPHATSPRLARAVEVYCGELFAPELAATVASETLGGFAGGNEQDLLRTVRTAAAKHVTGEPRGRRWRSVLSAERRQDCDRTPDLLAARANDELDEGERRTLAQHLNTCVPCQALEQRSHRAERAFAGVAGIAVAGSIAHADDLLSAPGEAEPPAPEAPAEEAAAPTGDEVAPSAWEAPAVGAAAVAAAAADEHEQSGPWVPPALDEGATVALPEAAAVAARPKRPRRRRLGLIATAAVLVAVIVAAVALLANGSSPKSHPVASASSKVTPAPVSKPAPVRVHKAKAAARSHRSHRAATHRSVAHKAAPTAHAAPPVTASAAPVTATSAPAAPSTPVVSAPQPSSPAPTSSAPAQAPAASSPSVSVSQSSSLGATNAAQGLGSGSKH